MSILTKRDKELIEIVQEQTLTFSEACKALDLDPARDLIGCDFSGIDFSGSNISGFNFTDADLSDATGDRLSGIDYAIFEGARIKNSVFERKEFVLPDDFFTKFYTSSTHFSLRIKNLFDEEYNIEMNVDDEVELVDSIIKSFYREPLMLCSALSLINPEWKNSKRRFDLLDRVITHEFPAVCIEALKALEKCATLKEISARYSETIFGNYWRPVRYACFISSQGDEVDAEFMAGDPKSTDDWLDPIENIQEGKESETGPFIYSQKIFEQGSLPSQNGYLSDEGGQIFTRLARRVNFLYKFDTNISGISRKRYYNRLNYLPTVDFYRKLFYMPQCFNLLNLASPRVGIEDTYTSDFLSGNTLIISSDGKQFELFDYLQSN